VGADGRVTKKSHKTTSMPLKKGDIIRVYTPGAGGFGEPKKRPVEKVLQDIAENKVSLEAAKNLYGVAAVLNNMGLPELDEAAVRAQRLS
jgi:N-methylhydantoinase B